MNNSYYFNREQERKPVEISALARPKRSSRRQRQSNRRLIAVLVMVMLLLNAGVMATGIFIGQQIAESNSNNTTIRRRQN